MKKMILILVVSLAPMVGSVGCLEYVAGVGTGAVVSQLLEQSEVALTENISLVEAENVKLEALLSEAESEADRAQIQAAIQVNQRLVSGMKDSLTAIGLGKQGVNTNWSSPESVGMFTAAAVSAGLAFYFRKKGVVSQKKYQAHKQAVNTVVSNNPQINAEMYRTVGEERAKVGV